MHDSRQAPDHLVAMIAALGNPPRRPDLSPWDAARAHHDQARRVADHIWAEAYLAGAGFAASITPAPPITINLDGTAEQLRASIATAAADYQRVMGAPATVVDLPGHVWHTHGANRIFAIARALGLTARQQPDPDVTRVS